MVLSMCLPKPIGEFLNIQEDFSTQVLLLFGAELIARGVPSHDKRQSTDQFIAYANKKRLVTKGQSLGESVT